MISVSQFTLSLPLITPLRSSIVLIIILTKKGAYAVGRQLLNTQAFDNAVVNAVLKLP